MGWSTGNRMVLEATSGFRATRKEIGSHESWEFYRCGGPVVGRQRLPRAVGASTKASTDSFPQSKTAIAVTPVSPRQGLQLAGPR